jgi:hypothetical protein
MHGLKFKYFILFFIFIILTSCATTKVEDFYKNLAPLIEEQDIGGAVSFASNFYENADKYNKLLYALELGLLYHKNGNYKDSNKIFEEVKSIYSMRDYISTTFCDDILFPSYYLGEDFEIAYTNFFCSLNYLKTKKFKLKRNEAVVEARQVNNLFNKIKIDSPDSIYKDDPFIRYFMGIIYQNAEYYSDAMISYKLALTAYSNYNICNLDVPKDLINNLYTLYCYFGLKKDANNLKKQYSYAKKTNITENLIVINYNGIAPRQIEQTVSIPFEVAWNKYYKKNNMYKYGVIREFNLYEISVNFPVYKNYNNVIKSFKIEITDKNDTSKKYYTESFLVTDFSTILKKHLKEPNYKSLFYSRINKYVIALKEIEVLKKQYEQKKHNILSNQSLDYHSKNREIEDLYKETMLNIRDIKTSLNVLNKLNLKSWRSLPETINMAKINLPCGKYNIIIQYLDKNGNIVETKEIETKINNKKNKFLLTNSYIGE